MKDIIFREYDIRGKVDQEFFIDQVYDLTRAIAAYFCQHNPEVKTIAVGMDGRTHSPAIKEEMCRALTDSGINVLFLGLCPTPALYFSLFTKDVQGGLMITASHNTKEYNGIKICLGTDSVWGKELQVIKNMYKNGEHITTSQKGTVTDYPINTHYIDWLCAHFSTLQGIDTKLVIDCGNGTAGAVIPDLVTRMNWNNVTLLYEKIDGTYPNHEADPTIAANMRDVKKLLETTDAQLGIGFDGDCDRMNPMTKEGKLVPGDQLLAIFAHQLLQDHPNAGIVFDIKSSSGLIELLEQWSAKPIMSPSGHSIIKNMMHKHHALLGGELSCHFFFKDRYFGYDDGIYAALRLLEIITQTGKTLSELLAIFPHKFSSRELRLACPEDQKQAIVEKLKSFFKKQPDVACITIDGVRVTFAYGWGIIRASNTQAVLSMRFESDTKDGLQKVIEQFDQLLTPYLSPDTLQELRNEKDRV